MGDSDSHLHVSATMATIQPSSNSEWQLYQVLQRANLLNYFETFISQGGDDVQQLCEAGEEEFLEIMALVGMASKPLHVRRLQKSLQEWVSNPAAFEVIKNYPAHVVNNGGQSSLSVTTGHHADRAHDDDDDDHNPCPAQLSPGSVSSHCRSQVRGHRSQVRDTSSSVGSQFDDPNLGDSQLGDYKDTADQIYSEGAGKPDPRLSEHQDMDMSDSQFMKQHIIVLPDPRLSEHHLAAIATAAACLAKDLPPLEPKSVSKKPICQDILSVMQMSADDPHRMSALRKYAAIYGRFDSRRRNNKPMNMHEISVNEAAAQLCSHCPALLTHREELFPLARQVVRESGYQYSKGHSRAADILLQSKLEMSDPVPSTFSTTLSYEPTLVDLEAQLGQVSLELSEITKEQSSIRSALRVLLESNDHHQMRKLTAEMDILNDRQTAMMKQRQKIKYRIAKCHKSVPVISLLPECYVHGSLLRESSSTKSTNNIAHITGSGCYGYSNEVLSGSPLATLYLAALQNQKHCLFEQGLHIATQYGMSDFAETLTGLKSPMENLTSQEDSGSKLLPKAHLTLEYPPHSADSVASSSSSSAVRSRSSSLLL